MGEEELKSIGKILSDFQITLYGFEKILNEMISISLTYEITLYDSAYAALGKVLNDKVYTADEKLLRRIKDLPFVFHIKDYGKR